jgi:hypothetical protein
MKDAKTHNVGSMEQEYMKKKIMEFDKDSDWTQAI